MTDSPSGSVAFGIEADSARGVGSCPGGGRGTCRGSPGAHSGAHKAACEQTREGTKRALLIEMPKRPDGATIEQIVSATGWQRPTVRGAFAGALKKRLGIDVVSAKIEGRGRVYRSEVSHGGAPSG